MESWLVDVKRVRIPRPKFGGGVRAGGYPCEPPKDYYEDSRSEAASLKAARELAKDTEDLRRQIQDKL